MYVQERINVTDTLGTYEHLKASILYIRGVYVHVFLMVAWPVVHTKVHVQTVTLETVSYYRQETNLLLEFDAPEDIVDPPGLG